MSWTYSRLFKWLIVFFLNNSWSCSHRPKISYHRIGSLLHSKFVLCSITQLCFVIRIRGSENSIDSIVISELLISSMWRIHHRFELLTLSLVKVHCCSHSGIIYRKLRDKVSWELRSLYCRLLRLNSFESFSSHCSKIWSSSCEMKLVIVCYISFCLKV